MKTLPPSVGTKFQPPTPVGRWVSRARLVDLLHEGRHRRLSLIHAPAGFGKSTLAAQWMTSLADEGVTTVWLSLDRDDNNTIWFLARLLEAIRRVLPGLDNALQQLLEERPEDAERYVVPALVNAIDATGADLVIAFDDWHLITDARTRTVVERLFDLSGPGVTYVVTSRSRAGLPLGRLMVRDQLVEVDAMALRFDQDESRRFLAGTTGLDIEGSNLATLHETTEGWVAALQLVSLSLRGKSDAHELIQGLSRGHHSVGDYLAENVLDALDDDVLDFLLTTCVPERLCAGLARALSGVAHGQAMLERVQAQNLFLQPLDEEGGWYRYHHLFEGYLRQRLERDMPGRVVELHLASARWYAENGFPSDAVDHALAAGDMAYAVQIVESGAMWLVEHSRMATLLALVAKIPTSSAAGQARIQMAIAWANTLLHQSRDAQISLDLSTGAAPADATLTPHDRFELEIEALVVQCCIDMYGDKVDRVAELADSCFANAGSIRPWIVSVGANISTFAKLQDRRFDEALTEQRWAGTFHALTSGPFSGVYGRCFAGLAASGQLDVRSAEAHCRAALELGRRSAGRFSHAARLAGALLGQLLYERGDLDEAERLLEESRELGSEGGVVEFMMSTFGTLARIKSLRGHAMDAEALLEEGEAVARDLGLDRLERRLDVERAHLGLRRRPGPPLTAVPLADLTATPLPVGLGLAEETYQLAVTAEVQAQLRDGCEPGPAQADETVLRAEHLLERVLVFGGPRSQMEARLLAAGAMRQANRPAEARDLLRPALLACFGAGLVRPVLDAGPACQQVVVELAAELELGTWPGVLPAGLGGFLAVLADAGSRGVGVRPTPSARVVVAVPSPQGTQVTLSQRELEILTLVGLGRSNREIALNLHLGFNTVKWYLKSLFTTLGVRDRRECVEEARRRNLLQAG